MESYKIFVSRSFDPRDEEVVSPALAFCEAAGFEPIQTDRASAQLPRDRIRDAISEARAFVGLLTRDPEREFTTKEWLITEIGMAEFAGLPILLFVEEGVAYSPAHHITSYTTFSRDDLVALCRKLVRSLVELREDSRALLGGSDLAERSPYRFLVDDIVFDVDEDGTLTQTRYIEVQSQISELRALRPIEKIITSSRLLGYYESVLDFQPTTRSVEMSFETRDNSPMEVSYQVSFDSALNKDETAAFTVTHRSRGSLPLSREQLEAILQGSYLRGNETARQGHAVKIPTGRLSLAVRFPESYQISRCSPQIAVTLRDRVGDSASAQAELDRVRHNFRIRHNRLEVEIEYPKTDHAYYFTWRPPKGSSLPAGMAEPFQTGDR